MNQEIIKKQFTIVKALVINKNKEILLIRRDLKELKEAHNKWEFPGGKVEFGESPENTAIRETKEETGYDIKIDYLLPKLLSYKREAPGRESQQILICYVSTLIGGKEQIPDHGVNAIKWINVKEMPKDYECLSGTIDFFEIYKQMNNIRDF